MRRGAAPLARSPVLLRTRPASPRRVLIPPVLIGHAASLDPIPTGRAVSFVRRWSRALEPEQAFRLPWRQQYDRARRFVVRAPPESERLYMQLYNPLRTTPHGRLLARLYTPTPPARPSACRAPRPGPARSSPGRAQVYGGFGAGGAALSDVWELRIFPGSSGVCLPSPPTWPSRCLTTRFDQPFDRHPSTRPAAPATPHAAAPLPSVRRLSMHTHPAHQK